MTIAHTQNLGKLYVPVMIKNFLIWTFTLTVCLLVAGFPLVALMVTIGSLLAIALQSVLPVSAVLLVAGSLVGANVMAILVGAAVLTLKGIHPHEVGWLKWLNSETDTSPAAIYAACPLTCDIKF